MAKNLEISNLLDFYGDVLTEKQRDVLEQYYNDDLSLAEIAENFGITRQGVRDAIKRGEGILLELEQKVGFVAATGRCSRAWPSWNSWPGIIRFYNSQQLQRFGGDRPGRGADAGNHPFHFRVREAQVGL